MQPDSLVNLEFQKQFLFQDLFRFLTILFNTFAFSNESYIRSMIGILGWFDYSYNSVVYIFYFLIFGYMIRELIAYKKIILPPFVSFALFMMLVSAVIFIFLALYLVWTPVGALRIDGVQGRYFLPIFPFFVLLIHQVFNYLGKKKAEILLISGLFVFIAIQSMAIIFYRYYDYSQLISNRGKMVDYINKLGEKTKIDYLRIDKPTNIDIEKKDQNAKIGGFQFYFTTHNQKIEVSYRYSIRDGSCNKIYKENYLDLRRLQKDAIYDEVFSFIYILEKNVCFRLEPVIYPPKANFFSIIYADKKPLIQLLYRD